MAKVSNGRKLYNHYKWRATGVCLHTFLAILTIARGSAGRKLTPTSLKHATKKALPDRAFLGLPLYLLRVANTAVLPCVMLFTLANRVTVSPGEGTM